MMPERMLPKLSKWLAFVLRHDPASAGLELDARGAAPVDAVAGALGVTVADLEAVVALPGKERFALEAGMIRARQGHTVRILPVGIGGVLPASLWHGTTLEAAREIARAGILPMRRTSVHLSETVELAREVAARRGGTVTLEVRTGVAVEAGATFVQTAPGIWLTLHVRPEWIRGAWLA